MNPEIRSINAQMSITSQEDKIMISLLKKFSLTKEFNLYNYKFDLSFSKFKNKNKIMVGLKHWNNWSQFCLFSFMSDNKCLGSFSHIVGGQR